MIDRKAFTEAGWSLENTYARLPEKFFSYVKPDPVRGPRLVVLNKILAGELGLVEDILQSEEMVGVLAGNGLPGNTLPIAQAYAGHQFGHFTMLGDGRAMLLGEQLTAKGQRFDIQLKGSGRTAYSRGGDGRAALGPMLREYIISEAMFVLGVSTTRSLAVVSTGEPVIRETVQPGAVLTRVAASHIRVGTFEYAAHWGSAEDLKALADYALQRHYPDYEKQDNPYLYLLQQVAKRQADLIAKWMHIGFIHGVMNTDNMTISGETIDYGPCAFMDTYDPKTVFSSIDVRGRYAYGNQPGIAAWNLARLAEALLPLLDEDTEKAVEMAQGVIGGFEELYHKSWLAGMRAKLGIFNHEHEDEALIDELLAMMHKQGADYTNTFRALTYSKFEITPMFDAGEYASWQERWHLRLSRQKESREESYRLMQLNNPVVIPRNHRVEEALEAAVKQGDLTLLHKLLEVLSKPYTYSAEHEAYTRLPAPSSCRYKTYCGT